MVSRHPGMGRKRSVPGESVVYDLDTLVDRYLCEKGCDVKGH